jgi:hypothetical protein
MSTQSRIVVRATSAMSRPADMGVLAGKEQTPDGGLLPPKSAIERTLKHWPRLGKLAIGIASIDARYESLSAAAKTVALRATPKAAGTSRRRAHLRALQPCEPPLDQDRHTRQTISSEGGATDPGCNPRSWKIRA